MPRKPKATVKFNRKQFGQRIRGLREKTGLTQTELAAETGRVRGSLGLIETGQTLPSIDLLMDIIGVIKAKGVSVSLDYICGITDSPDGSKSVADLKAKYDALERDHENMKEIIALQKQLLKK